MSLNGRSGSRISDELRPPSSARRYRMGYTKSRLCLFLCVPFLAIGCAGIPSGTSTVNLVVNPDFESIASSQRPSGWNTYQKLDGSVFRTVTDPGLAHSGATCVAIEQRDVNQRNYAVWVQEVPAKPRTTYRYSFWIKTDGVRPLTPYNEGGPSSCGTIIPLDANRKELPSEPPYPQSANVFMTHDWQRFEISFHTPDNTAYIRVGLALGNAIGTVYFDSISLVTSDFQRTASPSWLADAIIYAVGPWEFSRFGDGKAFVGVTRKLPELETLGVNLLYLLPLWENAGWYNIADHFALLREYGSEQELRALVDEAHRRGMRVILDLAGTVGVPLESRLVREHPEWFILGGDNTRYRCWVDLYGLDTNRPDVQQYFVTFATYYIERFDIDGYRCDMAMVSPYGMYENIRRAIQLIKPDAILIAEDTAPIAHETAFDATYDFPFLSRISSLISNPHDAGKTVRWLEAHRSYYPPSALHFRYLEGQDLDSTIASRCGLAGSRAFAALLLTIDGIPVIYNGQEVGNTEPQVGWWKPPIDWNRNPDAARYRETYTTLTHIRAKFPALRRGLLVAIENSDDRVAAYARVLPGEQTVLTVINFSDTMLETQLDLSQKALNVPRGCALSDLLDDSRFAVSNPGSFVMTLQPYQSRILVIGPNG
jgi:cyclomaltodextrinase